MREEDKKKLIDKICKYGIYKEGIIIYLNDNEFEKKYKFEKQKDQLLSEIVNIIKEI